MLVGLFCTDMAAEEGNIREGSTRVEQQHVVGNWELPLKNTEFSVTLDESCHARDTIQPLIFLTRENCGGAGSHVAVNGRKRRGKYMFETS